MSYIYLASSILFVLQVCSSAFNLLVQYLIFLFSSYQLGKHLHCLSCIVSILFRRLFFLSFIYPDCATSILFRCIYPTCPTPAQLVYSACHTLILPVLRLCACPNSITLVKPLPILVRTSPFATHNASAAYFNVRTLLLMCNNGKYFPLIPTCLTSVCLFCLSYTNSACPAPVCLCLIFSAAYFNARTLLLMFNK